MEHLQRRLRLVERGDLDAARSLNIEARRRNDPDLKRRIGRALIKGGLGALSSIPSEISVVYEGQTLSLLRDRGMLQLPKTGQEVGWNSQQQTSMSLTLEFWGASRDAYWDLRSARLFAMECAVQALPYYEQWMVSDLCARRAVQLMIRDHFGASFHTNISHVDDLTLARQAFDTATRSREIIATYDPRSKEARRARDASLASIAILAAVQSLHGLGSYRCSLLDRTQTLALRAGSALLKLKPHAPIQRLLEYLLEEIDLNAVEMDYSRQWGIEAGQELTWT